MDGLFHGARIIGDATEQAYAEGLVTEHDHVLAVSDPRGPWGLEQKLASEGAGDALSTIGFTPRARNPKDAGDAQGVEFCDDQ